MNIVIANRRYFPYSGPERYMFSITDLLKSDGHTVMPFSVKRTQNTPTEYDRYFVRPPYGEDIVHYRDANPSLMQKARVFANCVYSLEAKRNMKRFLADNEVDLLYMLQVDNDISPSIIHVCRKQNIPVVMRLSAFSLICGSYFCLRNNEFCTLCSTKNSLQCIKHKCIRNEFLPSFVRSVSMMVHNFIKIYDYIDAFVCPSKFLMRTFIEAGFPEEKFHQINSFVNPEDYQPSYSCDNYSLYFGRLSSEKGIEYLLNAQSRLSRSEYPLYLAGEVDDPHFQQKLDGIIAKKGMKNVRFLGYKSGDELKQLIRNARFILAPSVYADNSPMSITESLAMGKPIIGSDIGGITDQIADGCGFLVPPKDDAALAEKMKILWQDDSLVVLFGKNARKHFDRNYSPHQHYEKLEQVFKRCLNKK